jgi:hypothetical protein
MFSMLSITLNFPLDAPLSRFSNLFFLLMSSVCNIAFPKADAGWLEKPHFQSAHTVSPKILIRKFWPTAYILRAAFFVFSAWANTSN